MRIIQKDNDYIPQFNLAWEVAYLLEQPDIWIPLYEPDGAKKVGEIHSTTHHIRLCEGVQLEQRHMVVLGTHQPL